MALQGKLNEAVTFWGICCCSWIHMNSGTSKRDYLTPMGCESFQGVQKANLMVSRLDDCWSLLLLKIWRLPVGVVNKFIYDISSWVFFPLRSILLMLLCVAMGGTVVIENPGSSMIWLHLRFQWLLGILERAGLKVAQRNQCFTTANHNCHTVF